MRISARNQLKGKVISVDRGPIHAKVRLALPGGQEITSIVSADAIDELAIAPGTEVFAIIKAQNVMLGTNH